MTLFFHGQEVPWRLQLPESFLLSFSGKADSVKVALGCPAVHLGVCLVSRDQRVVSGFM